MSDDATTDTTTMDIRKFLKTVGVSSHQEIEKALEQARKTGKLDGVSVIAATMRLEIPGLDLVHTVEGEICVS